MEGIYLYVPWLIERGISMNNKLLIAGVIATTALLGGCSTNIELENKVAALTNQVSDLSTKVDGLASDHKMMKADTAAAAASAQDAAVNAQTAAGEAERANARIDNIVDSYKK